jgi:hypothetical protein
MFALTCARAATRELFALQVFPNFRDWSFREASMAPSPDGVPFVIAEDECVILLHDFTRKGEVCLALLYLRAGEGDLVSFTEAHAHIVEEGLRA